MKKYEYKLLKDNATKVYDLDNINELGKKGWRVVWIHIFNNGDEETLLERELE